jgi:hypothetical protein
MRGILLLLVVVLTGCDGLFNIDHVDFVPPTPDAAPIVDGPPDAYVVPALIARFEFENNLANQAKGDSAICVPNPATCPTYEASGRHGSALRIGGGQPCVKYTLPSPLQSFTAMMWIDRGTDDTAARALIAQPFGNTNADSWLLNTDSNRDARFITNNGSSDDLTLAPNMYAQTWQHVAISYNVANQTKRIYADGSVKNAAIGAQIAWNGLDVTIGCDRDSGVYGAFFLGKLDDVRIYDRALTDAEISSIAAGAD